jgi:hypothetical protein
MEKLFWSFLASSLDRYQDGDNETRDAFVEAVTAHMNEAVIGTKRHLAQWTFPLKDNKGGGKTVEPRNINLTVKSDLICLFLLAISLSKVFFLLRISFGVLHHQCKIY